jgi:hypothetical protein
MPDIFTSPKTQPIQETEQQRAAVQPLPSTRVPAASVSPNVKGSSLGLLSYFRKYPLGVKFANQEDGEQIILFIRRHFITNVPWILFTLLLLILPLVVIGLFRFSNLSLFAIPPHFVAVLLGFYYLIVLNNALVNFIVWFYHVGIVSEKRLLDLDVYNVLNHHLAETNVIDIVDVSYAQRGFFQSFFNYGDVPIQTEAIKANFEFEECPRPAEVSDIITDLKPDNART